MADKTVYSYHTFIFPFIWGGNSKTQRKDFEKCINRNFKLDVFGEYRSDDPNEKRQRYAAYQYFNAASRAAVYTTHNSKDQIVHNYRYDSDLFDKNSDSVRYVIKKATENNSYNYSLRINGIRLKLFDTGIGMLIYELENEKYPCIEDVNRINDWGRRIFRPYYENNKNCSITADYLSVEGISDCFGNEVVSRLSGAEPVDNPQDNELARVVTFLLENDKYKATIKAPQKNEFLIEPIIDDRMFVACYYVNAELVTAMADYSSGEYRYLSDALEKQPKAEDNISRALYEFVFADGDGICCHDRRQLRDMLEKHIYFRWGEYRYEGSLSGTVYGSSEYSFVCLAASTFPLEPFLTEYVEMAMLVLAQRASLLAFEKRISEVSRSKKGEKRLQEHYIDFDSRYMLLEVTAQQQGIEIYSLIQKVMFIVAGKADVENQITNLFNLKDYKINKALNWILAFLSFVGFADIILKFFL